MAPSLPACISSTFCSHRQASWFLLATLSPFFLPFLILCVPFLLLFLAPVSVFLFSLLLLYKVHVFMRPKLKHSHRRADKGEGYQPIAAAEKLDIHQQAPLEEDREFKCLEGSNVQSAETHTHHKEGDGVGVCLLPSRVPDFEEEKRGDLEQDGITEDKIEENQEDQVSIEGPPSVEEDREGISPGGFPEYEGPEVYSNVELPASSRARVEVGLQSTRRESNLTEETQEDMGKELLRNDRMEDNKQEEEEVTEELIDFKDDQKHSLDATSSRTSEENRTSFPMTDEGESLDTPYNYDHRSSAPIKRQGEVSLEDRNERLESSHMHPLEEDRELIGPSLEEDREGRSPGGFPEYEGPEVYSNVELPVSSKARVEEGLQSTKRVRNLTEETQEDMRKELLRSDRMEDNKQEEEEVTEEFIDSKDNQKHSLDATSSRTSEENRTQCPMTDEGESLDTPYSYDHRSSAPIERQGEVSLEDRNERLESSHMHPMEEAWGKLPAIQVTEPNFQAKTTVFPDQIVEKPWEGHLNEHDRPFTEIVTHEHGEELELSSKKDQSLGNKGGPDKNEDTFFPAEPSEKETEEGERSYSSPEGHGQWRTEAFSRDDEQPRKGRPAKNAVSFEAESSAEREEGYPSEATSSAVPPPHVSHGGIEFQDRIQEEQKIMADINSIKKIVGYQGEPHSSILEQISALYMFLGMEPYNWGAEVDNLERAQAEIELLKVVVGVK